MDDIIERLEALAKEYHQHAPHYLEAAGIIKQLRYDHERDVEKVAALQLELEQLRSIAGPVDVTRFREIADKVIAERKVPHWPEVGTHE